VLEKWRACSRVVGSLFETDGHSKHRSKCQFAREARLTLGRVCACMRGEEDEDECECSKDIEPVLSKAALEAAVMRMLKDDTPARQCAQCAQCAHCYTCQDKAPRNFAHCDTVQIVCFKLIYTIDMAV